MKEKLSKVKEFVEVHELDILFGAAVVFSIAFGIGVGKLSVYEREDAYIGIGALSAIETARVNGLEAAENIIKESYKLKK